MTDFSEAAQFIGQPFLRAFRLNSHYSLLPCLNNRFHRNNVRHWE